MAKQRVADHGRQENRAQRHARLLEIKRARILQKQRTETAHAAARKITQAESKTHGDKQPT